MNEGEECLFGRWAGGLRCPWEGGTKSGSSRREEGDHHPDGGIVTQVLWTEYKYYYGPCCCKFGERVSLKIPESTAWRVRFAVDGLFGGVSARGGSCGSCGRTICGARSHWNPGPLIACRLSLLTLVLQRVEV